MFALRDKKPQTHKYSVREHMLLVMLDWYRQGVAVRDWQRRELERQEVAKEEEEEDRDPSATMIQLVFDAVRHGG